MTDPRFDCLHSWRHLGRHAMECDLCCTVRPRDDTDPAPMSDLRRDLIWLGLIVAPWVVVIGLAVLVFT